MKHKFNLNFSCIFISNIVLKLINTRVLKGIGITTAGFDYTTSPTVIGIGNSTIITRANHQGGSVESVDIISSDSNLRQDLKIIPTNNSNGVFINLNTISSDVIDKL